MAAPKPTRERQRQLAAGLSRIEGGASIERAARAVGVPASTLRDWHRRCYAAEPEAMKTLEDVIVGQAMEIASTAGAELASRVPDLDDGKLIAAWGTAVDKIALRQGWSRGSEPGAPAGAADAMSRLIEALDGKTLRVSVSVSEEPDQAIEVEAERAG